MSKPRSGFRGSRLVYGAWLLVALVGVVMGPTEAAEPGREQVEFFEKKVRPLLVEHCHRCHGQSAGKQKGGLAVDSLAGLLKGGDSGPALVPGHPDRSLLIKAVRHVDAELRMPPRTRLADDQIETLTRWVKLGAPWPDANTGAARRLPGKITDEDRQWWAFQPVRGHQPPEAGAGWARNDIDRFVFHKLQQNGLNPAPEASRAVLVRRLHFDLWGLPPSPEEVDAVLADRSANWYEVLVDRLLASPRHGEKWARHWLDLVRYADSDGYRIDDYRPNAWRYRDYVIQAFNDDKPYDRFVQEQLAGDELFPANPEARVATGYLRHWIYEYNNRDVRGQWSIILNDLTDTTGDVFLGLGVQCARCHDHKFDPILQKDYYRLQAFFAPILPREDLQAATPAERDEYARRLARWEEKTADLRRQLDVIEEPYRRKAAKSAIEKFPEDIQAMIRKPVAERAPLEHQLAELAYRQVTYEYDRLERTFKPEDKEKVLALRRKLLEFEKEKPSPLPPVLAATDVGPHAPPVFLPRRNQEPIEPGYLSVLDERPAAIPPLPGVADSTGRRAALARWLTQPDQPLTSRVLVNRVWQYHFGRGLSANASDFGRLGEKPSHPELLDWLAGRFVQDGWSLKKLHRLIVTSAAYRQSATHPQPQLGRLKDPENRLLWRGNVQRLEAEQIRDALFAVTGELNLQAGGPGGATTEARRTIHTRMMRNTRDPLLDVFDAPYWFSSASGRDITTTPVQSLLLINSQLMLHRARALADRLRKDEPEDETRRIVRAYRLAFGRPPAQTEVLAARAFLAEQTRRIDPRQAGSARAAFVSGKVPFRDGQAAAMSPDGPQSAFEVPHHSSMPGAEFTIEAFVVARSIWETGAVRTIASKWTGDLKQPGWAFGITGKKSRRKPQTVVLQLNGKKLSGSFGEEAIFSDQHIQLNKPYYLAAAVKLAGKEPGQVTFYAKDLSNDDEPLLVARVPHTITGGLTNEVPFTIGGRTGRKDSSFDGLVDDVRLSSAALGVDQLLFTNEGTNRHTIGYWPFEARPDVFRDASGHDLNIQPAAAASKTAVDVARAALVDFCHALLNASEFLYVE